MNSNRMVLGLVVALALGVAGCCRTTKPLAEYARFNGTPRANSAQDYIQYLKGLPRFAHGALDGLPSGAIIFHGDPVPVLQSLGYASSDWNAPIELGTTDPESIYVVRPKSGSPFIVARGLPGAGGIATEAAELAALGVKRLIHIGTSGGLGPAIKASDVVVSAGAYKDGAAVMLTVADARGRVSQPDARLSGACGDALRAEHTPGVLATGYTIPIYYNQPSGLIRSLLSEPCFGAPRPEYIEMEESAFFEEGRLDGVECASLTVAADRYSLANGALVHEFLDSGAVDESLKNAMKAGIAAVR